MNQIKLHRSDMFESRVDKGVCLFTPYPPSFIYYWNWWIRFAYSTLHLLCRWASEGNVSIATCNHSYMALTFTITRLAPVRMRCPSSGHAKKQDTFPCFHFRFISISQHIKIHWKAASQAIAIAVQKYQAATMPQRVWADKLQPMQMPSNGQGNNRRKTAHQ